MLDLAGWIARDSLEVAYRFLDAAESSILSLRRFPGRGSPKQVPRLKVFQLRTLAVVGFPKHLIFYEVRSSGVFVFAVLHGSRDYRRVLRGRTE